jgi:putative peptidoglycan lipid II flippase
VSLIRASAVIGSLTLVSRVLGFLREALLARYLGAGWVTDCFLVAFKLPNLFRRLFAEGAFSSAFVPLFARTIGENQGDATAGKRFAEDVLALLLLVLIAVTALAMIFMPALVFIMTGGFKDPRPGQVALTIDLARLAFPYLLLISLVSLLGGVLNGLSRFGAAAAAPILLNLVMIGALVGFGMAFPDLTGEAAQIGAARALSVGITVAGIAQLLWLVWVCHRAGVHLRLRVPRFGPRVKQFGLMVLPAALGQGAMQINLIIDGLIANKLAGEGALSWIYFADRLAQLPLGVIGVAVGTALLPTIARQLGEGKADSANLTQNRGAELALLLAIPAALALIVLAEPIVRLAYERGAFTPEDTRATMLALMALAAGLPAFILIKVLTPGFFARNDTRTPVVIALVAIMVNTGVALALVFSIGHVGIAAATAVSAWVNVVLLLTALIRRGWFVPDRQLLSATARFVLAASVMAGLGWFAQHQWPALFDDQSMVLAIAMLGLIGLSLLVYFGLCLATGAIDRTRLKALLSRRGRASAA